MCRDRESCCGCIFNTIDCSFLDELDNDTVDIIEEWSKANPIVTNRMKFREVFGINTIPLDWWDKPYKGE